MGSGSGFAGYRDKEAKAEVAGVTEKDRAFHWLGKLELHDIAALVVIGAAVAGSAWLMDFHPASRTFFNCYFSGGQSSAREFFGDLLFDGFTRFHFTAAPENVSRRDIRRHAFPALAGLLLYGWGRRDELVERDETRGPRRFFVGNAQFTIRGIEHRHLLLVGEGLLSPRTKPRCFLAFKVEKKDRVLVGCERLAVSILAGE